MPSGVIQLYQVNDSGDFQVSSESGEDNVFTMTVSGRGGNATCSFTVTTIDGKPQQIDAIRNKIGERQLKLAQDIANIEGRPQSEEFQQAQEQKARDEAAKDIRDLEIQILLLSN